MAVTTTAARAIFRVRLIFRVHGPRLALQPQDQEGVNSNTATPERTSLSLWGGQKIPENRCRAAF